MYQFRTAIASACTLSFAASIALAQAPSLSLRGTIADATGAIVPGATILLQSPGGAAVAETRSGSRGNFTLPNVSPGDFTLLVPAVFGFAQHTQPIHLVTSLTGVKVTLALDTISQTVTVGDNAPISTDPSANQDVVTVSGDNLRKLPVFDQNFIAALTPFLDPASISSGGATIIVDGVEMKASGVSPSAIQEVRINSDPYVAEFTRPGRGRIEIITKPGSPSFHGEANFLFRDATLNARNYFAPIRPPEQRRIFEGHFTGPVGHGGHTAFILSGARREEDLAVAVHAIGPLSPGGSIGPIDENVQTPNRESLLALRVTRDLSPAHRLALQYNIDYETHINQNVGGLVLPEAGINTDAREDDLVFNDRILVSPNLVNQLQITFEKDEDVTRSVTNGQSLQISGAFIGGGAQADLNRTENTVKINDIVSWTHKNHYLRFGANIPQISRRAVDDRTNRLGTFNFSSLSSYTSATPFAFTVQQGPGRGLYWINEVGGFFQDQIKINPRLQVSLGLRYDWQTYLSDGNNFSPRVSAAYSLGRNTILRTGAGIFYDRTGGDFPAVVKLYNGTVLRTFQILNPGFPNAVPPGVNLNTLPTNLVRFDPSIRTPYTLQSSIGIERQLHKSITLTAGYRNQVQIKAFRSRDINAPVLPVNPSLTVNYARPNPAFGQVRQIEADGRQLANSFDLAFRGQAGRWFAGQAQYSLARAYNNTAGLNFFPEDQYNPNSEWARAGYDRLQRFDILGNINPDHWLTLGIAAALYSGLPYTLSTGADFYHTGLGNARPPGSPRNNLQAGGTATLDLSWAHEFRLTKAKGDNAKTLSAQVSAFNILNRTNYTGYIGNQSSPLFGHATSAQPARQLQVELGYKF